MLESKRVTRDNLLLLRPAGWSGRLAAVVEDCATGFVAIVAIVTMIAANRTADLSGSRGNGDLPQG